MTSSLDHARQLLADLLRRGDQRTNEGSPPGEHELPDEYGEDQRFPSAWEEQALNQRDISFDVIDLVLAFPDWVHRRKERAEIQSESHVQWHCSVDFTLPDLGRGPARWLDNQPISLVPMDLLAKRPLVAFDCRDGDGRPVPTLTRRQNGLLANAAMTHWARELSAFEGTEVTPSTEDLIQQVTLGERESAVRAIGHLLQSTAADQALLAADSGYLGTLTLLADNFILIGLTTCAPGERRILKYSYERQLRTTSRSFAERLALRPTILEMPVPMFRDCESYHFEAVAPPGTHFASVVLRDAGSDSSPAIYRADLSEGSPHVAHASASRTSLRNDPRAHVDPDLAVEPTVSLVTRLERGAWLQSAAAVSGLVTTFMWATLPWILGWNADEAGEAWCVPQALPYLPWRCAPAPGAETASTDPAALLVGIVGLITFAVVRQGEHAYTSRLVGPLRYIVWTVALLPVVGAWLIAFPGPGTLLRGAWLALCVAATAGSAVLVAVFRAGRSGPAHR